MEKFEALPTPRQYYDLARTKVESFIDSIDPDLAVGVEELTVDLDSGRKKKGFVLKFVHPGHPELAWTMDVAMNRTYIANKLEEVVRKIYTERKRELGIE